MKITVGVPHYRSKKLLGQLINHLDKQKISSLNLKKDVEVIIVNNHTLTGVACYLNSSFACPPSSLPCISIY